MSATSPESTGSPAGLGDLVEQARRRAGRARLLAQLTVEEPGEEAVATARALPSLAPAFEDVGTARTEYERVLLREVSCHESTFLQRSGELGVGDRRLLDRYRRWDFEWEGRWRVAAGDHLGVQLHFYAHLCDAERDGWQADRPERATEAVEAQRTMLAEHLGWWAPVAAEAMARVGSPSGYGRIAQLLDAWLTDELDLLRPAVAHPGMPPVDGVDEEHTTIAGAGRMARRLLVPARAGGYLARDDIARAAAAVETPWRPSDTRDRLRHVVRAAMDSDRLSRIAKVLDPTFAGWERRWADKAEEIAGAARTFEWWRLRAAATREWLAGVDALARGGTPTLVVPDAVQASTALARLSARGFAVATSDLPAHLADDVDALVRVAPDVAAPTWDGDARGVLHDVIDEL